MTDGITAAMAKREGEKEAEVGPLDLAKAEPHQRHRQPAYQDSSTNTAPGTRSS